MQSHRRTTPILPHSVRATTWKGTARTAGRPQGAAGRRRSRVRALWRCASSQRSRTTSRTSCSTAELLWSCSLCERAWDVCEESLGWR
uniref:Uncharacterized protein n=1 Tax=Aegilops tauschii subsp. strangulata TaxID=200361 RepID=A0A453M424_AEGTS